MDKYTIPKTIFLHATENEVVNMIQQQKIHNEIMSNVKSVMKKDRENKLHKSAIKLRKEKRENLRKQIQKDLGIPFSLTFKLTELQQFGILYDILQHHYRLKKVQTTKRKTNNFQDIARLRKFAKTSHQHRQRVYTSARKRYLGISKQNTIKQLKLKPKPPSTKKKKLSSNSIRKKRTIKQIQKQQELNKLIQEEMHKIIEMRQIKKRHKKRHKIQKPSQRVIQSARNHSDNISLSHPKKQIQSARSHQINNLSRLSVLDKLLIRAEKDDNAVQQFGLTMPVFIRRLSQFMESEKKQTKKKKKDGTHKPKWNDTTLVPYIEKKRNIRTLLSSTDIKDLEKTKWLKRKAYGNIIYKRRYHQKEMVKIPSLPLKEMNLS